MRLIEKLHKTSQGRTGFTDFPGLQRPEGILG
jgi:hypothetical protein